MTYHQHCAFWKPIIVCFGGICCFLLFLQIRSRWPIVPIVNMLNLVPNCRDNSDVQNKDATPPPWDTKLGKEQCLTACQKFMVTPSAQKDDHTEHPETAKELEKKKWLAACQKVLPKNIDTTWGSHVVVLLAALFVTDGPIVEFGCGLYSTPLIHNFTQGTQRQILSADTVVEWLERFRHYESPTHKFKHVNISSGWQEWEKIAQNCRNFEYDLILIDHHPDHRRTADAVRVANCGKIVILHDTESKKYYKYGPVFEHYKCSYETQRFGVGIMAMSNFKRELVNHVEKLVNIYLDSVHCSALDCS